MAVSPARRQKSTSADETARVLRIFDLIDEELARRTKVMVSPDALARHVDDLLALADRIASRTED